MKVLTTYGIGQKLKIKNFEDVKQFGITSDFVTIRDIDMDCGHDEVDIRVDRTDVSGYQKIDKYYDCNGKFDGRYRCGFYRWDRKIYKDKARINFDVEIVLKPLTKKVIEQLNEDVKYIMEHGVTGFYANYTICNGGGSYIDMKLEDAIIAPVLENNKYIGFDIINLRNFKVVKTSALHDACEGNKTGKQETYSERPRSNDYNSDRDHFWGGIIIGGEVKTNESGYDASL
jgi:hypothetical protein